MSPISILTAIQTMSADPANDEFILMQDHQMHLLFADVSEDFMREMSPVHEHPSFYMRMRCVVVDPNWRVEAIEIYKKRQFGQMHLEHLPNTLKRMHIITCNQCYSVETRYLPRELDDLNLSDNQIFGSLDLTVLPPHMRELDVRSNRITGPVNILRLPKTMMRLYLHNNRIVQDTLYFDEVSERIICIDLNWNKVKRVRHVSSEKAVLEPRIIIRPYGF